MKGGRFFFSFSKWVLSFPRVVSECTVLLRSQWMKRLDEFHNELAQKTNANSLKEEKKVNLKRCVPQVARWGWIFRKRTTWFLILFGGCFDPQNSDQNWFFSNIFSAKRVWVVMGREEWLPSHGLSVLQLLKETQFLKWLERNEEAQSLAAEFHGFQNTLSPSSFWWRTLEGRPLEPRKV